MTSEWIVASLPFAFALGASAFVAAADVPISTVAGVAVPRLPRAPTLQDFDRGEPQSDVASAMARVDAFQQWEPTQGEPPSERTVAYLGHDAERLHVVFAAFDRSPASIRAHLARRDDMFADDRVGVWLDTFADQRQARAFMVNPRNVQGDFEFTDPETYDLAYDAVWDSRAALMPDGYVVWIGIPFRSLRFPNAPTQHWRVLLERTIAHKAEGAFWPGLTNDVEGRARQFGALDGVSRVSPGRALQVAPYTSFRSTRTFGRSLASGDEGPATLFPLGSTAEVGFDAKAVFRDSVVLDATVHPDFSQIESDEPQVIVNRRYEVFFPEKRPFFLENAPLFRSLTDGERVQLFFSRRIVDPSAGARLTGRLGPWTMGALVADDQAAGGGAGALDAVAVLRRDLPGRSDLGVFGSVREGAGRRNLVLAGEGRVTLGTTWSTAALLAVSSTRDDSVMGTGTAGVLELRREGAHLLSRTRAAAIGPEFRGDLGFVPRTDMRVADQMLRWRWRPGRAVIWHGPHVSAERVWDHHGRRLDSAAQIGYEARFAGATQWLVQRRQQVETYRGLRFRTTTNESQLTTGALDWLYATAAFTWGSAVHHDPAAGLAPSVGPSRSLTLNLALRPVNRLRFDETLLITSLKAPDGSSRVFEDRVLRSRIGVQLTRALSLRAILDYRSFATSPRWSSARPDRSLSTDLLAACQLGPATAVYVGYGRASAAVPASDLAHHRGASELTPVGRQLFVKVSYLFRP